MEELHGIIGRKVTEQKKLHLYLEELRDIGTFQELSMVMTGTYGFHITDKKSHSSKELRKYSIKRSLSDLFSSSPIRSE